MSWKNCAFIFFGSALLTFAFLKVAGASETPPEEKLCKVVVCNKLERFTLSISNMIKDSWGETCMETYVPKELAVKDTILSSDSRWYQGSFNPTKKSVTRVSEVLSCQK